MVSRVASVEAGRFQGQNTNSRKTKLERCNLLKCFKVYPNFQANASPIQARYKSNPSPNKIAAATQRRDRCGRRRETEGAFHPRANPKATTIHAKIIALP